MRYKALTFLIILLGIIRVKAAKGRWVLRKDRDEQNLIPGHSLQKGYGILLECCDCGLAHRLYEDDKGIHCIPERPSSYDYSLRIGR